MNNISQFPNEYPNPHEPPYPSGFPQYPNHIESGHPNPDGDEDDENLMVPGIDEYFKGLETLIKNNDRMEALAPSSACPPCPPCQNATGSIIPNTILR